MKNLTELTLTHFFIQLDDAGTFDFLHDQGYYVLDGGDLEAVIQREINDKFRD